MPSIENNTRSFMWSSIEPGFTELKWVLQAVSRDPARQSIQCLHIDVNFIVATDGNRLHLMTNDYNAPIGLWRPKATSKKVVAFEEQLDMEFPNYDNVLPTHGNRVRESFSVGDYREISWGARLATPFLRVLTYAKKSFNIDYLQEMFSLQGNWTIETTDETYMKPLVAMREDTCLGLLMPMKG